jgi:hypothetical protein
MACTTYKYGDLGDGLFYHVLPTLLVYIVFFLIFIISVLLTLFIYLVGGSNKFYFVHSVGNVIIPTDELHHFSEG